MKKSKNNKIKNTSSVFLGWTIASGVVAGLLFFVCMLLGSLASGGLVVSNLMEEEKLFMTSSKPQIPCELVTFLDDDILDLGEKDDGYYYTIIYMVYSDYYDYDPSIKAEYVVLKKYGSTPSVKYYSYFHEVGQLNPYVIVNELSDDDFSNMIDDEMIVQYPNIFADRTEYVFKVIDMETDILSTPEDYELERSRRFYYFLFAGLIYVLSILEGIVVIILGCITLLVFISFIVFLNIYCKELNVNN